MSLSATGSLRKLIFLETFSTPLEFLRAAKTARDGGDLGFYHVIEKSLSMDFLRTASTPSQLVCESETRYARLYSNPGSSRERLLVAFTGAAMRMMMPLPIFMQSLPKNTDLLILYDPQNNHYRSRIWDGNTSLSTFASIFQQVFSIYEDTISVGTSIGGLPALRFAKFARLRRGISIGGQRIDDTLRILRLEDVAAAFDPLCACDDTESTEAIFIHSAENMQDSCAAQCASVASNSHVIAIEGRKNHGILWDIAQMRHLPELLEMFFSESPAAIRNAVFSWSAADLGTSNS